MQLVLNRFKMPSRFPKGSYLSRCFQDEFEIQDFIGEGSFGKVYKCLERTSEKTFAVKELPRSQALSMETFDNEVEIWKGLEHENIVSLHRTFRDHSFMYLVCEHIEGGSLFDEIVGHKVYGEEQALNIMKQVSKTNKTFLALL